MPLVLLRLGLSSLKCTFKPKLYRRDAGYSARFNGTTKWVVFRTCLVAVKVRLNGNPAFKHPRQQQYTPINSFWHGFKVLISTAFVGICAYTYMCTITLYKQGHRYSMVSEPNVLLEREGIVRLSCMHYAGTEQTYFVCRLICILLRFECLKIFDR